jgi:uncharacterized membrane protein YkoI
MTPFTLTLVSAAAVSGLNAHVAVAADNCLSDWTAARQIVSAQNLLTVEQLADHAGDQIQGGQIIKTTLCYENGSYIYRLVVRDPKGQLKSVAIDARGPVKSQSKR